MPGYLTILRRHLTLIVLLSLSGLLLGAAAGQVRDARYEAVADVRLSQVESPFRGPGGTKGDLTRAMQTQIDIATGDDVRQRVRAELGYEPPITVAAKGERDELEFRAVADSAQEAADAANAWSTAYVDTLRADAAAEADRYLAAFDRLYTQVYDQIAVLDAARATATGATLAQLDLEREVLVTQVKALAGRRTPEGTASAAQILASPVRAAQVPSQPMPDAAPRLLALGLFAGLVGGYLLACLKEARRDEVRSAEDIGIVAPGTAVLGPLVTGPAVADLEEPGTAADFQSLRAELSAIGDPARHSSVIAVTSAVAEAGVGEVAAGLAVALAKAGRRVVLVDAELQHPRQHVLFSTQGAPGLVHVLKDGTPLHTALVPVRLSGGAGLTLLPAGAVGRKDLLAAPVFRDLVRSLTADPEVDAVVIASPQLLGTADALAVAELATSVLVIAALRRSRRRDLGAALRRLSLAHPPASAVVLASSSESSRRRGRRGSFRRRNGSSQLQDRHTQALSADGAVPTVQSRPSIEPADTAARPR
jgi:Mrp family chromosome partitioning ATPase